MEAEATSIQSTSVNKLYIGMNELSKMSASPMEEDKLRHIVHINDKSNKTELKLDE